MAGIDGNNDIDGILHIRTSVLLLLLEIECDLWKMAVQVQPSVPSPRESSRWDHHNDERHNVCCHLPCIQFCFGTTWLLEGVLWLEWILLELSRLPIFPHHVREWLLRILLPPSRSRRFPFLASPQTPPHFLQPVAVCRHRRRMGRPILPVCTFADFPARHAD